MAKSRTRRDIRKLFDERERLVKEYSDVDTSFKQFLQDLESYRKVQLSMKQAQELNDYLIFGASFQK